MKDSSKVLSGGLPVRLLEFSKDVSLASVIEAIKAVPDDEVTLKLPPDTPWLKNPVNEKILRKSVQQFGKTIKIDGKPDEPVKPIKVPEVKEETPEPEHHQEELSVKDDAGFVVGGDIMDGAKPDFVPAKELHAEEEPLELAEPEEAKGPTIPLVPKKDFELGGRQSWWGKARRYWPVSLILALAILAGLGWYVIYALPKADVNIVVAEQSLSRDATITASTSVTAVNADSRKIPATTKSSNQTGSLKANTTGSKDIGTNAKGTVAIFNLTGQTQSVPTGTLVSTTVNGTSYQFTVDSGDTVPADTQDPNTLVITPGKKDFSVTASKIGPEYNLNSGNTFTIGTHPPNEMSGKNASAFANGSKQTVQIVAQADLDKLTTDLTNQLSDKAKSDLTGGNNSNLQAVDQALKTTVTSKSFTHQIGDQATDVTLNMSVTITATLYNTQDMKDVLTKILSQAVPDGFELSQDNTQTSADYLSPEQNGDLDFTGHIKANLIPKFDHDALAQNLAGKKTAAAETYLKGIPSVVSYQVNIWPNLPSAIQSFPHDVKRIHINVTVQQ